MASKNTTNYAFLKKFKPELYKLAVKMEEDLLITPISMLAYATRFLEYILYDIAESNNHEVNRDIGFVKNIYEIIELDFIDFGFGDLLIKAYRFRNSSIHNTNIIKSLKEDKKTAFELDRRLFDIADAYYKNSTNDYEEHVYNEPMLVVESPEDFTNVVKQDKHFDKCIICGESNKLTKSNFCRSCDDLLNYRDILSKIIIKKGKSTILKSDDFDYPFKKELIKDLLSKNILEIVGNDYYFVSDNLNDYFKLTDEFMKIDEFLVDLISGYIENPSNSKFYACKEYPYIRVSNMIDEYYVREILKLHENGFSLEYCFEHVDINKSDLKYWYELKKSEFLDGNKDELFIRYNEFLIKDLFRSIEKTNELNVGHKTINFWAENFEGFSEKLSNKLSKMDLKLFMQLFRMNGSKEYALNQLNITRDEFDNFISIHKRLADEYFEEVEKRKRYFLTYLKVLSLTASLEEAKLDKIDFEKDREDYLNGNYNKFYLNVTEMLQQRYLDYRKRGLTTQKICETLAINEDEIEFWFSDESFEKKYLQVRVLLFKRAIKSNKSKKDICDVLEITEEELDSYIKLGESGDEGYVEFFNYLQNDYYPILIQQFLKEFREKSNLNTALDKTGLTKKDLNDYLNSNEEVHDEFINIKIDKIVTTLLNKGKVNKKLLKRLDISKEEYAQYENRINEEVMEKQLEFISSEIYVGDIVYRAAKNVNCDIDTVFEWIYKGSVGDEKFEELANYYWEEHIHLINEGNSDIRNGVPIDMLKKIISPPQLRYDIEYWKKWGLINRNNTYLSIEDIKNIIMEVK